MTWLAEYTRAAFDVVFALIATGFAVLLTVAIGMMFYALYKGATDETWR
jgi:hypothetical protein